MSESSKVQLHHLERSAYLYVRQSSMRQVIENVESTKRQYALRGRAIAQGWREDQIVVVDSDQGESGASAVWREGFQHLVADVSMGRAGIVMGLEVSRLARNNADWHRLLEICALADTLILDEDGMYDPANFNDRLLLGLKGTMSEAELHVLKARLRGGILNKVRRGEYHCPLPTGFVYDEVGNVARSRHADPRNNRPLLRDVLTRRLSVPDGEGVSQRGPQLPIPSHRRPHHRVPASECLDRSARLEQSSIRRRLHVWTSPVSASHRRPEKGPAKARL
jgi:DNA invertase Pin-like site-specific DNA recombinase